jgi:hypothetical protein
LLELNKITILDQAAIDEIRNAVVAWYYCEEGAPAIHPKSPMAELIDDGYMDAIITFCKASIRNLEKVIGKHSFKNPLIGLPPFDRHSHGVPPIYFDGDQMKDVIEIDITLNHLNLIKNMTVCDWAKPNRPAFDPKRVFNDHRDATVSAYVALNGEGKRTDEHGEVKLSRKEKDRYKRLWLETAPALQVIVRQAEVEPGIYVESFFSGFRRIGSCDDYTNCRVPFKKLTGKKLSRKEYIEIVNTRAKANELRKPAGKVGKNA